MSVKEQEIRDLIFSRLDALERYRLAMSILEELKPVESIEISDAMIEEYQIRKEQLRSGKMSKRPWREVMADLLKDD